MATRVGFIGTGTMGRPMAEMVLAAGHHLTVYDRAPGVTNRLLALGAAEALTPAEAATGNEIVLLSLPGPTEVVASLLESHGVLDADVPPRFIIDLSTNSPEVTRMLAARCADVDITFVDAPVSGGPARATSGTLTVLVGGTDDTFDAVRHVLGSIGDNVVHVGPVGAGSVAKIVNNQLFLAGTVAVQEAYLLGASLGVGPDDLHRIITASSAGPYAKLAPLVLGRAFDDVIFRLDIAAKDLRLAVECAAGVGVEIPVTVSAAAIHDAALEHGDGPMAFHATLRELERRAGIELRPLSRSARRSPGTERT